MQDVLIVPTGTANVASVAAAFTRLAARSRLAEDGDDLLAAPAVVLPGVGAFGAAVEQLARRNWMQPLRARIEAGRPTLAICLGMQLLCAHSDESPGVAGLGVIADTVRAFAGTERVPQLGWNRVAPDGCELLEPGVAYFANSYRLLRLPAGWAGARTDHGGPFVSALERGAVLACQFHPEISGAYGARLLGRWLAHTEQVR